MTGSRIRLTVAVLGAAVLLAILLWSRANGVDAAHGDAAAAAGAPDLPPADVSIAVEGAAAVRDTLTLTVSAAAQLAAWRETLLPSHVPGQVLRVSVRDNDVVRAGQEIVAIDPSEYRLAVREAEAALAQARVQLRELTLFDDRIDDADVRAERERAARVRSGFDAAEIRLERARLELSRTIVRAPFAGRVASVAVTPGQWIRAGDPLLRVLDLDPIRVEVQVLEGEVRWLEPGSTAEVEVAALPGVLGGVVATVNPLVDPELRTARVTVVVPNPGGRLLPGMYARVRLATRRLPDRLLVPRSAILERERRALVFVYHEENGAGVAKWRYVTPGLGNDDFVELMAADDVAAVEPGEIVLTAGHYTLVHDAPVRLIDDVDGALGARPE